MPGARTRVPLVATVMSEVPGVEARKVGSVGNTGRAKGEYCAPLTVPLLTSWFEYTSLATTAPKATVTFCACTSQPDAVVAPPAMLTSLEALRYGELPTWLVTTSPERMSAPVWIQRLWVLSTATRPITSLTWIVTVAVSVAVPSLIV